MHTPISHEVLNHMREHNYDGQGKSQMQEADDSMVIVVAICMISVCLWGIGGLVLWMVL